MYQKRTHRQGRLAGLKAENGARSGEARLRVPSAGRKGSYEWAYSRDGVTWTPSGTTPYCKTIVTGLTPGKRYLFRYLTTNPKGTSDWSDPVFLLVG